MGNRKSAGKPSLRVVASAPKPALSKGEARKLTEDAKRDALALWRKLYRLYRGGAHTALGYPSWGAYFQRESGGSDAQAYRLLQAARVMHQLPSGSSITEAVARELSPLLGEPTELDAAWSQIVSAHPKPTAALVRDVVQRRLRGSGRQRRPRRDRPTGKPDLLDDLSPATRTAASQAATIPAQIPGSSPGVGTLGKSPALSGSPRRRSARKRSGFRPPTRS